ncbi:B3 domain-containing protein [Pyrus ussuriensis x Pyrus communis]|uniref:B3 domain-containing protein n=1 Tax=Pyrus ussuriensis x Pyrus communis TaxID=2448454 RepID=A0A5N5FVK2_9ROSA|nr:B3 domain-containing protein [Pyrus ussuriensis x Pyrus communis]
MARKLVKHSQKKQSFYTILLGDFSRHLRIPPKFVKNFNGRSLCKCVLRGPNGLRRTVELEGRKNGLFFDDGWQYFVKDHHLEKGDFLVFKYDGKSKFKVAIYDTTACEKDVEIADSRRMGSSIPLFNIGQALVKEEINELQTDNYNENCENKVFNSGRRKWKLFAIYFL